MTTSPCSRASIAHKGSPGTYVWGTGGVSPDGVKWLEKRIYLYYLRLKGTSDPRHRSPCNPQRAFLGNNAHGCGPACRLYFSRPISHKYTPTGSSQTGRAAAAAAHSQQPYTNVAAPLLPHSPAYTVRIIASAEHRHPTPAPPGYYAVQHAESGGILGRRRWNPNPRSAPRAVGKPWLALKFIVVPTYSTSIGVHLGRVPGVRDPRVLESWYRQGAK